MAAARSHHSPRSSHAHVVLPTPPPPHPPPQPEGASCVIWYRDPATNAIMVLVGVESRYVRDRHTTEAERTKLEALMTLERFLPASKTEAELFRNDADAFKRAAKAKFTKRVQEITAAEKGAIKSKSASADTSHVRIQFDTPIRRDDGDSSIYEARFRELKFDGSERQQPKLGIIKGGREECDETLADTVVREVAEEIGLKISKSRLQNIGDAKGYACYSFKIEPADVANWEEVFASRHARNYGELFHLGFLPLHDILRIPKDGNVTGTFRLLPQGLVLPPRYELKMNQKTIGALNLFLEWINPFSDRLGKSAPEDKGKGGGRSGRSGRRRAGSRKMIRRNRRGSRRLSRRRYR